MLNEGFLASFVIALLAVGLVLLLAYLGKRSHQRRLESSQALLRNFESIELRLEISPEQAALGRQLDLVRSADETAETVEKRVRDSFPELKGVSRTAPPETAIRKIQDFLESENFAVAIGAGEIAFYALWDGLEGTPFAEAVDLISERIAEIAVVQGGEAVENIVPAVKTLLTRLGELYQENPEQIIDLLTSVFGVLQKADLINVASLLKHILSPERIEIYLDSAEMVVTPLLEGAADGAAAAGEGIGSLDWATAFQGDEVFSPDFHLPVLTIVLSTVREIQLLDEGKTTIDSAFANTALDAAGTGVGGWVGAKAGAAAGTAVAPGIGTLIGGILGAIGGGLLGRMGTNKIKYMDVEEARSAYNAAQWRMKQVIKEAAHRAHAGLTEIHSDASRQFGEEVGKAPRLADGDPVVQDQVNRLLGAVRCDLEERRRELSVARSRVLSEAPEDAWYDRFMGGRISPELKSRVEEIYSDKLRMLRDLERQLPRPEVFERSPLEALEAISKLPLTPSQGMQTALIKSRQATENLLLYLTSSLVVWARYANDRLQELTAEIPKRFESHAQIFRQACELRAKEVRRCEKRLRAELEKVGAI